MPTGHGAGPVKLITEATPPLLPPLLARHRRRMLGSKLFSTPPFFVFGMRTPHDCHCCTAHIANPVTYL